MSHWQATPNAWAGETCHVLGCGPSLLGLDASKLRGRVIAANHAGLDVAPHADVLIYADERWRHMNRDRLHLYKGPLILTGAQPTVHDRRIRVMPYWLRAGGDRRRGLSTDPARMGGGCSGSRGVNIAFLQGAAEIILHGFDMRPGHYHSAYAAPSPQADYDSFIATFQRMAEQLAEFPVRVWNATPGSALTCFPSIVYSPGE